MLTVVLYALAAIAVAAVIVVVLVVVLPDDQLAPAAADRTPTGLPLDRPVGADDLEKVRLPVGVRGYRMVDTDAVIDRLVGELERRDQAIAALRAERDQRTADGSRFTASADGTARPGGDARSWAPSDPGRPWAPPSPDDDVAHPASDVPDDRSPLADASETPQTEPAEPGESIEQTQPADRARQADAADRVDPADRPLSYRTVLPTSEPSSRDASQDAAREAPDRMPSSPEYRPPAGLDDER